MRHVANRLKTDRNAGDADSDARIGRKAGSETRPLTEPVFLMLMSLAEKPRHGYALIKDVEMLTGGRVRLTTGTLFGAIRRLLDDRLIERFEQEDTTRDKKAYRLTDDGVRQLELELNRMKKLTRVAIARLRSREEKA